jgi:UDP-N-acetylmuramoylalanine--D-glutamate ligase
MKTRIFRWQHDTDFAIANANDPITVAGAGAARGQRLLFASSGEVDRGAFLTPMRSEIVIRLDGDEQHYPIEDLTIIGTHNLENAMCAYLATTVAGLPRNAIRAGAARYQPRKHRMELIGTTDDIAYYDDSKGTNVAAVAASIAGFPQPVVLIAGGVDKGGSYEPMLEALDQVARGLVLIGEAAPLIRATATRYDIGYPIVDAVDMNDAVKKATTLASAGDAVVLSPACSSYDMFENFEARGEAFRQAFENLGDSDSAKGTAS